MPTPAHLSYQYEVMDMGDQVYKQLLTYEASEAKFKSYGRGMFSFFLDLEGYAQNAIDHAVSSVSGIKGLLAENPELGPTLANPVIEDNGNYYQDKVEIFGEALHKASYKGARYLIDKYVDLSLLHVSYGFMERVFKVTVNCGVDANDEVVLIDLGELTFDKHEATDLARSKKWLRQEAFAYPFPRPRNFALPNHLKPYFARRMHTQFSTAAVAATWQSSVQGK